MKAMLIDYSARSVVFLLIILATVQCVPLQESDLASPSSPASEPSATLTWSAADFYEGLPVQVVSRSWTVQELLSRSELERSPVWVDGHELTFFYQGEADAVHICCGIQSPMQRIEGSDLWVLTVRISELSQAVISYSFTPCRDGRSIEPKDNADRMQVWRGPEAPLAPERAETLQGRIEEYAIDSVALGERRDLTVYLPPGHDPTQPIPVVYAADGDSVRGFATTLDPLIASGSVPAVIVVGVHTGGLEQDLTEPYNYAQDLRVQEYLLGENSERFEAHERFFVYEVAEWAEQNLGAAVDREQRAVFGFSNGGAFAVTMGVRHPERYANVIAFSLGMGRAGLGTPKWSADMAPRHYLVAGTLEPFRKPTARWASRLVQLNVEHIYRERVCGHDSVMWEEEFPEAVAWAFLEQ